MVNKKDGPPGNHHNEKSSRPHRNEYSRIESLPCAGSSGRPSQVLPAPEAHGSPGGFMSTPASDHYKGFDITVQAMRRRGDSQKPSDAMRHFDIVVNLTRQGAAAHAKSGMFGMPTPEPFDSPIAAHKAAVAFAHDLIDGKIEGQSVDDL
jgi:hypothetical protein